MKRRVRKKKSVALELKSANLEILKLEEQLNNALAAIYDSNTKTKRFIKGIESASKLWQDGTKFPNFMHNSITNQKVVQTLTNIKNNDNVDLFL